MRAVDDAMRKLMQRQHGHLGLDQAHELGASTRLIRRRETTGVFQRTWPRVTSLVGTPESWIGSLWAAHLQLGPLSVVSHESAAELRKIDGVVPGCIALITRSTGGQRMPGVHVHRVVDLAEHDVVRLEGLPVTTPARTMVDLAATASPARLRYVLQGAVGARLCSLTEVGAVLARVRRRGKPGVSALDALLDDLAGDPIGATRLEEMLDAALAAIPGPRPQAQRLIAADLRRVGTVDRIYPDEKLIVEADGRRWHMRQQRMAEDRRRDAEAAAMGYLTIRFMWEQLDSEPAWCRGVVREALAHRRGSVTTSAADQNGRTVSGNDADAVGF